MVNYQIDMKKFFVNMMMLVVLMGTGMAMTGCSEENSVPAGNELNEMHQTVLGNYVNGVVVPTYRNLADAAILLAEDCSDLSTQEKVDKACRDWKAARQYWELSEAFLFGAAADYNIDPHIDSWPLDLTQLSQVLKDGNIEEKIDAGTAGYGLLGFHAIEYVIFQEGSTGTAANRNRQVGTISEAEKAFAAAVSEDMRNQCVRLEAAWAGMENVSAEKQDMLAEAELEPSMNYGENLMNAGLPGNAKYKTTLAAFEEILVGASDIANEVGNTKIADPMASGKWSDVESPHSWNSVTDFIDNLRSVRNAYLCSLDGSLSAKSVSACVASVSQEADTKVKNCINEAIKATEAMPTPFRNYINLKSGPEYDRIMAAVEACNNLVEALDEAMELMVNGL